MKALQGHEVYTLSPDELAQWKKAIEPLKASWAEGVKKVGGDPVAIEKELQAELAKRGAGF